MGQEVLETFQEDFAMLMEGGFLAIKQRNVGDAENLFRAAQTLRPDSTFPNVGFGYIELSKLKLKKAVKIFQSILDTEEDNYLAQTFLGVCYLLDKAKKEEGDRMIREAIEKTDDDTVKNLGNTALDWAKEDIKKVEAFLNKEQPDFG